jgi:hypothetical protein
MGMRVCYLDCHDAGLYYHLVVHTENLLRRLQMFYFHMWPIYWIILSPKSPPNTFLSSTHTSRRKQKQLPKRCVLNILQITGIVQHSTYIPAIITATAVETPSITRVRTMRLSGDSNGATGTQNSSTNHHATTQKPRLQSHSFPTRASMLN